MTTINSETLDKIDRFRNQGTSEIRSLELPDELAVKMRQRFHQFIDKTIDEAMNMSVLPAPTVNSPVPGVEY
jgi:hypothetical protein